MIRRYSIALISISVVVAAMFIYSSRHELIAAISSASVTFALLTFVTTLAYNLVIWIVFHSSAGAGKAYLQTSKMYFGAQVAKYMPGKVWGIVYQATLKAAGMPMGHIVQANIVVLAVSVISTVFVSLALIVYPVSLVAASVVLLVGGWLSAYILNSDHLYQIIQRLSRLAKRFELTSEVPEIEFSLPTRFAIYGLLTALYVVSNICLLYIFFDIELAEALQLIAYLGIAWLAGLVVAVTPSGLGVREVVFVALGSVAGTGSYDLYASIAIVVRVVQVFQDLAFAFLVPSAIGFFENKNETRTKKTKNS
jgi:hypothetical protein